MEKARLAEEAEKAKTKAESAKRHLKRDLQKLTPKDRPSTFMSCFERLACENGVAKECWASCFVTCLSGDYLSMWASYVDSHEDADYDAIKAYFLNRVGLNWDSRSGLISCPRKPYNLTWDQYFYQCVEDLKLLTDGAASVEEACNLNTKALFCNFIKGASCTDLTRKKIFPCTSFYRPLWIVST